MKTPKNWNQKQKDTFEMLIGYQKILSDWIEQRHLTEYLRK
jgi:hypothetical protein